MIFNCHNLFASRGDSGGLCWFEFEDKIYAVGIIIMWFADRLFMVVPLQYIQKAYEQIGYTVNWKIKNK